MTFYFYDVETSGFNPRTSRIMQFAGQRTDMDLKPIGEPDNILIKLTPDVLPDPDAVLVTGITPQQTITDGINEAEFLRYFQKNVYIPDTIMVGFNNIRFDDEFMRFSLWRNFYDAYEWQWKNGCSKWDLLDVVRMTRALRPDGIKWPFASDGTPSNRLELLSNVNKLDHTLAHDALSDVQASISLAKLITNKQPKLFSYLLNLRDKQKVEALLATNKPVVYTSGRYPSEYEKTTVAVKIAENPYKPGALMYDLRIDPTKFTELSPTKLIELWNLRGKDVPYFPIKTLAYNRCPALAPLNVLDNASAERINLSLESVNENMAKLKASKDFGDKLVSALQQAKPQSQAGLVIDEQKVDGMLYEGFVNPADKTNMSAVRAAGGEEIKDFQLDFKDDRLKALLPLYKARNYPKSLSDQEKEHWEKFRTNRLLDGGNSSRAARYFKRLNELSANVGADSQAKYLLEELNLYAQSIVPSA